MAAAHGDREPTDIADHRADCCAVARAWLECLDSTLHRGRARRAPPAWIAQRWTWGASSRPLHWCEIPEAGALDRGTSAALARELWSRRCDGIRAVQLVEQLAGQRATGCNRDGLGSTPTGGVLAYHEAIGREQRECLEIWDCTACAWRHPAVDASASATRCLRVHGASAEVLWWGEHRVIPGSWNRLGSHGESATSTDPISV
jgi:hypothetical protein